MRTRRGNRGATDKISENSALGFENESLGRTIVTVSAK